MALDLLRTVRPDAGLVRELAVLPPNGDTHLLWSVVADIGQGGFAGRRVGADEYPLTLVGACGARRAEAFVRGCGEAVERAALLPTAPLADAPGAPWLERGALWAPEAGSGAAYAAREPATGRVVRVPAPAIDYPAGSAAVGFDPTPSGAAAGATQDDAVAAALRELVERDVATVAWARQARIPALDLDALAATDDPSAAPLAALLQAAAARGLTPRAALAPTGVPGADCVIAAVLDEAAGVAAAGLAVADRTPHAAVKAVQEALQVRTVLLGVAAMEREGGHAPLDAAAPIDGDHDRARWWARPEAVGVLATWLDHLGPAVPTADVTARDVVDRPDWLAAVPSAAIADLTPRLPAPIRALGWHAVKALAPDLQPLRMSEHNTWAWNPTRLTAPERDWGVPCETSPGTVSDLPHPFI